MRKILRLFGSGLRNGFVAIGALVFAGSIIAVADYFATQGTGTSFASVVISGTHYMANLLCDAVVGETRCATIKPASTASVASDTSLVVQINPDSPGIVPTASGQNQTFPTGWLGFGCEFTTTPTTITSGNGSPLACDNANNLLINIKAGTVAATQSGAWTAAVTQSTSPWVVSNGGTFAVQAAQSGTWTVQPGNTPNTTAWLFNMGSMGGTAINSGCVSNYGTAPGAVACPSANVYVTNTNTNGSAASASSSPVVIASDQTAADACMFRNKTNLLINQNGTSSVQLIALSGSTTIYVCSISLFAAGATTVAITTGTGTACATGNAGVWGATTANIANSVPLLAGGGLTLGNGGGTVMKGAASSELCMVLGTNVYVSGNLTYVQI